MRIAKRVLLFFLCAALLGGGLHAEWAVIKYEGNDYVTLKSFCKFYKLTYPENSLDREDIVIKNVSFTMKLRKGSRSIFINQARHWTSLNVERLDEDWIISRKDVAKLFDPILRPYAIEAWPALWKGVIIDPGHGGEDRGAISRKGKREKDYTLDTAFRLEKILKSQGIATVMTRRSDVFIELEERAQISARYSNYIFVSIHFNDATGSARGIETYCFPPLGASSTEYEGRVFRRDSVTMPGNANDTCNIFLASCIHQQVLKLNPGDEEADRGVKRARFVVLKGNRLPSVLVEGGFLSNRQESSRLEKPEYRQSLAEKIALGIQIFFNRGVLPKPVETKPPSSLPSTNAPSTNAPSIHRATTNQVGTAGTNVVKSPSTNSLSLPSMNRPPEKVKPIATNSVTTNVIVTPLSPATNSVSTNSASTNAASKSGVPEQTAPVTPLIPSIASTNVVEEFKPKPAPEDEVVIKPKTSTPSTQKPEGHEEAVPSHEEPTVEIYMQTPPKTRPPQVNLRLEESASTNSPPREVKP